MAILNLGTLKIVIDDTKKLTLSETSIQHLLNKEITTSAFPVKWLANHPEDIKLLGKIINSPEFTVSFNESEEQFEVRLSR